MARAAAPASSISVAEAARALSVYPRTAAIFWSAAATCRAAAPTRWCAHGGSCRATAARAGAASAVSAARNARRPPGPAAATPRRLATPAAATAPTVGSLATALTVATTRGCGGAPALRAPASRAAAVGDAVVMVATDPASVIGCTRPHAEPRSETVNALSVFHCTVNNTVRWRPYDTCSLRVPPIYFRCPYRLRAACMGSFLPTPGVGTVFKLRNLKEFQ